MQSRIKSYHDIKTNLGNVSGNRLWDRKYFPYAVKKIQKYMQSRIKSYKSIKTNLANVSANCTATGNNSLMLERKFKYICKVV